jgi:hypothetical protein
MLIERATILRFFAVPTNVLKEYEVAWSWPEWKQPILLLPSVQDYMIMTICGRQYCCLHLGKVAWSRSEWGAVITAAAMCTRLFNDDQNRVSHYCCHLYKVVWSLTEWRHSILLPPFGEDLVIIARMETDVTAAAICSRLHDHDKNEGSQYCCRRMYKILCSWLEWAVKLLLPSVQGCVIMNKNGGSQYRCCHLYYVQGRVIMTRVAADDTAAAMPPPSVQGFMIMIRMGAD